MKIKKYQKPSGPLPKKSFWWNLANQLSTAPSNGETTIAAHSADLNRQVEQARKEAKSKGQNPDRAEEEVYKKGLRTNGAIVGGAALGSLAATAPAVAETVKFATKTPVGKKALQKVMKDTAISMAGGTAVDALSDKMTGMSFGRYIAGAIPGARNLYDRSGLARFGIDMLNPGYLGLSGSKALIEGTQKGVTNLAHKVDNAATIANARLTGKLKFGNPTTYTGIHQSNTPLTEVKFPFNRWDVTTHGADPNGFWLTLAETPNTEGTMASRPFASRWTATAQKPLIQTGEIENLFKSKNNLRNAIVRYGKRRGADAFEFRGIKDNALPTTNVVMVTDKTNPTLIEQVSNKTKNIYETPITRNWGNPRIISKPGETNPEYLADIEAVKEALKHPGYIPPEAQKAIDFMTDAFKSPWYKQRHFNVYAPDGDALSLELAERFYNDHVKKYVELMNDPRNVYVKTNNIRKFRGTTPEGVVAFDTPLHNDNNASAAVLNLTNNPNINRRFIFIKNGSSEDDIINVLEHEIGGHVTEGEWFPHSGYDNVDVIPEMKDFSGYLLDSKELRARGLPTSHHMYKLGYDPNSETDWLRYYLDERPKLPNQKDIYYYNPKTLKGFTQMLQLSTPIAVGLGISQQNKKPNSK